MAYRYGLGPVFLYDWLTMTRRWQVFAARSLVVAVLLTAFFAIWFAEIDTGQLSVSAMQRQQAMIGEKFFYALIGTQLTLVLLAAPAITAGTICIDKRRGTLAHLLMTDLSNVEIVMGKLAVRLLLVLSLLSCGLPVLMLGVLLGGIAPEAVLHAFVITCTVAVLGCAFGVALSVKGTKTYEVMLANYLFWALALLALPGWIILDETWNIGNPPPWLKEANPYWLAFVPYALPGTNFTDASERFVGGCLAISLALVAWAVWRVRSVALSQAERASVSRSAALVINPRAPVNGWGFVEPETPSCKQTRPGAAQRALCGWLIGPSLDGNPVLWRDWHHNRPSTGGRVLWGIFVSLAVLLTGLALLVLLQSTTGSKEFPALVSGALVGFGLLFMSVTSVTSLAEERMNGTLDMLLTTPLGTRAIVRGKWWGGYRRVLVLAVLPLLIGAVSAASKPEWPAEVYDVRWRGLLILGGLILAAGAAVNSLGLALATWISRPGRAIAWSVTIYLLITVGLYLLLGLMSKDDAFRGLAMASPFYGTGALTYQIKHPFQLAEEIDVLSWGMMWIVFYVLVAALLYRITVATFERCVGRIATSSPTHHLTAAPAGPF